MAVTQVIKWGTSDGTEFDTEDAAITYEAYLMRKEELDQVLGQQWYRGIERHEVIEILLRNFTFTAKE